MAQPPGSGTSLAPRTRRLPSCPVCRHGPTAFSFASVDLLHGVPGIFAYDNCPSCRSFFQNPIAVDDDLSRYYPEDYFTHDDLGALKPGGSSGPLQSTRAPIGAGVPQPTP